MLHTIKKGNHYDDKWLSSWPHIGATSMSRYVRFHESCRYELPGNNQRDVNKLFGLSFGLFAVHNNSARVGWYWEPDWDCIVLVAYCYANGQRNWNHQLEFPILAKVKLNQAVHCKIEVGFWEGTWWYTFTTKVADAAPYTVVVDTGNKYLPHYGFTQSLYFGGGSTALHDMQIEISKRPLA